MKPLTILLIALLFTGCNRICQDVNYESGYSQTKIDSTCQPNGKYFWFYYGVSVDTFVVNTQVGRFSGWKKYGNEAYASRINLDSVRCAEIKKAQAFRDRERQIKRIIRNSKTCKP